jgi:hypothetical protein
MKKGNRSVLVVIIVFSVVLSAGVVYAGTEPELNILSPKRGEEIPFGKDVVIAISIYDPDGDADKNSIEFEVDGTEITQNAQISVFLATYPLKDEATSGRHTFTFTISDNEGNTNEIDGFFNISPEPKKERVVSANGSIRAGSEYDDGADQAVLGILDAYVYGRLSDTIDYSASAYVTNEDSLDGQRVSSFRLNLFMPFMGLVLGDATPSFSTYTIDGMQVRGVHALPQFGGFGMELLFGQSLNKVTESQYTPTFSQRIYGVRIKAGQKERFLWGLSFLKVKDQTDSLSSALAASAPPPQENLVLGTDFTLSLMDGIFVLEAEANESMLNTDITTGSTMLESWEWLFTVGNAMTPVIPGFNSLAARAGIKLGPLGGNTFNGEFSYVGPAYNSLANTSIVNDRIGGRVWDSLWLLDDKLFLSAGFQYYVNNLEDTASDTTQTIGTSASTYVYPTDSLSINAGFDLQSVSNNSDIDTLNTSINAGANQNMDLWITDSDIYLNGTVSLLKDNATPANDANTYSTRLGAKSYFTPFPLDTKLVFGYDFGDTANSFYIEGKGGYRFLKNENLYTFADVVFETGIETLDVTVGAEYEAPLNLTFEGEFEFINAPDGSDILLSAFATWEF